VSCLGSGTSSAAGIPMIDLVSDDENLVKKKVVLNSSSVDLTMIDLVSDDENLGKKEVVLTSSVSEIAKSPETLPQKQHEGIILFQFNEQYFFLTIYVKHYRRTG
jgi:hypothetical protein